MSLSLLPAFLGAVAVICAMPGPDMLFVAASGLCGGARAGIAAAFGMAAAIFGGLAAGCCAFGDAVSEPGSEFQVIGYTHRSRARGE